MEGGLSVGLSARCILKMTFGEPIMNFEELIPTKKELRYFHHWIHVPVHHCRPTSECLKVDRAMHLEMFGWLFETSR